AEDKGGLRAGRREPQDGLRDRCELRNRPIDVRPWLGEHLDHADATQGLRFDGADVIDGTRGYILTVGGDTFGHVVRGEASILPEDGNDRNVDSGEDVSRPAAN